MAKTKMKGDTVESFISLHNLDPQLVHKRMNSIPLVCHEGVIILMNQLGHQDSRIPDKDRKTWIKREEPSTRSKWKTTLLAWFSNPEYKTPHGILKQLETPVFYTFSSAKPATQPTLTVVKSNLNNLYLRRDKLKEELMKPISQRHKEHLLVELGEIEKRIKDAVIAA